MNGQLELITRAPRTIVIGDVHGCSNELASLFDKFGEITKNDHVIFLGDLIDKGPDSAGVVRMAREISEKYRVTLVQGNHEEMFLRWHKKPEDKRPVMKRHEDFVDLESKLSSEDIAFLGSSVLYTRFSVEHCFDGLPSNFIACHAGIPAWIEDLPEDPAEIAGMSSKMRKRMQHILRLRYQTPEGKFVALGTETDADEFWAYNYDGRFGFCLFGHQPTEAGMFSLASVEYRQFRNALPLDQGCVFGGGLSALVLSENEVRAISIPAEGEYAETLMPAAF